MVKQKKTDRDKWYYAAKEQGFRSRAAFKLIQINKKFNFLSSARACLDLCAAPGGWLQVASKYMPVSSIIIGVDLFPIRPIRNVITLKEDITTQKCRHEIKKNLKGWKVDVCLHDGAPNLGTAWVNDAYGQSVLTLAAVGLAVDFLREGGTFVTKVFRSTDYNSLLWVFNQLFKKVTVTKPPSSRNTSAEIFVVCEGFLAPKQLDPRFLDPKHVFKELDAPAEKDLFFGQKRAKRNREGYDDGVTMLYKHASVSEYINSDNPTVVLANNHKLEFDRRSKIYLDHPLTTNEIKNCCEDLQVLGRNEIKLLLRWRLHLIKKLHNQEKSTEPTPESVDSDQTPLTEEQEEGLLDKEIQESLTRAQQKVKAKLKKERKKQRKLQHRIDLKMDLVGDKFDTEVEEDLFGLSSIKSKEQLENIRSDDEADVLESDDDLQSSDEDAGEAFLNAEERYEEEIEKMLDRQYEDFLERSKALSKAITIQKSTTVASAADTQMAELAEKIRSATEKSIYDSDSDQEMDDVDENPLLVKEDTDNLNPSRRASQWFSQGLFSDLDINLPGLDTDSGSSSSSKTLQKSNVSREKPSPSPKISKETSVRAQPVSVSTPNVPEESEGFEVVPVQNYDSDSDMDEYEKSELLAMATLIKNGKLTLNDLVEDGYNRYTFNDNNLPDWFEDEEMRHRQPNLPVTKEMVREIMAQNKALDARPIKKVAEAKARKKMKAKRALDKVKQKAVTIADDKDLPEAAKARAIEKLYKSQMAKMKVKQIYVVRKKGQKGKGRIGPKNSGKARVKVVDKRMKADKRGQDAAQRKRKR